MEPRWDKQDWSKPAPRLAPNGGCGPVASSIAAVAMVVLAVLLMLAAFGLSVLGSCFSMGSSAPAGLWDTRNPLFPLAAACGGGAALLIVVATVVFLLAGRSRP
jgi:hypothetical protein